MRICRCCHDGLTEFDVRIVRDKYDGRLDGYCHRCALMRCDAYPRSACRGNERYVGQ